MISSEARNERGLTLTEITVVMVLATVLMLGLTGFYMNAQSTWLDGSTQAITQREATLILEAIRDVAHHSSGVVVVTTGPLHDRVAFLNVLGDPWYEFWCDDRDSLLYHGSPDDEPRGPVGTSIVGRFQLTSSDSLLTLDMLELRTQTGFRVRTTSSFAILNR
jgi:type II secretory pathway pseudopilin PulG